MAHSQMKIYINDKTVHAAPKAAKWQKSSFYGLSRQYISRRIHEAIHGLNRFGSFQEHTLQRLFYVDRYAIGFLVFFANQ